MSCARKIFLFLGVCILVVVANEAASAGGLPVTIGLDDGTKQLLRDLPKEIEEQFEKAVNAAMDRADRSVEKYIASIQTAAKDTTKQIACVGSGLAENAGADLKAGVIHLIAAPLAPLTGLLPAAITAKSSGLNDTFRTEVKTRIAAYRASNEVDYLFAEYSDIAFDGAGIHCQEDAKNASTAYVDKVLGDLKKAIGEWNILDRYENCKTVADCVKARKNDITSLMANEGAAIISNAGAPSAYAAFLSKEQTTDDVNVLLSELYDLRLIELRIAWARSEAQIDAAKAWAIGTKIVEAAPGSIDGIEPTLNHITNFGQDFEHVFTALRHLKNDLPLARSAFNGIIDPRYAELIKPQLDQLDSLEKKSAEKLELVCTRILTAKVRGILVMQNSGGYNWCNGHKVNRWVSFQELALH